MHTLRILTIPAIWLVALAMVSCHGNREKAVPDADILVSVGDSSLTMSEVILKIPTGMDPVDSAEMFHSIVDGWVRDLVLSDVARKNIPDMDRIEKMVEAYRNNLIVNEYLSSMGETANVRVPEENVREYYDSHSDEFVLSQPLVKGAYIRVDESDRSLDNLRRWMTTFDDASIDNIEKSGLRQATAYEYFRDEWVSFGQLAERIPYRFGDADAFLRAHRNFETQAAGSVYLLHVSDYLPTGQQMPYEYARRKISEILLASRMSEVREKLKTDIYRRRIADGFLKPGLYDPVKKEMKTTTTKTE